MPTCLNQNFLWKCNFNQVFQHRHISLGRELTERDPLYSANFFTSSSCSGLRVGGFGSLFWDRARGEVVPCSDHHLGHWAISCFREEAVTHPTSHALLPPPFPPMPPTREALLSSESTTQWKSKTSFFLPLRGKTEAHTDDLQAQHCSTELQHSALSPLASHRASSTASPNLLRIQLLSCPAIEFLSIQAQAKACK